MFIALWQMLKSPDAAMDQIEPQKYTVQQDMLYCIGLEGTRK